MIITQLRRYQKAHTDSVIYVDGKYFSHGLEDAGRPDGVKIQDETCIPEGTYKVRITHSPSFKRDMCILFNQEDDHSINRKGIRFTGIRVHGGSNIEHTAGCQIVAKHSDKQGKVWGSMEDEMLKLVKAALARGEEATWIVSEDV